MLLVSKFPSLDPGLHGGKKKGGEGNIFERLDRGVASTSWISMFPQASLVHHIFTSSDHCQISLNYLSKTNS